MSWEWIAHHCIDWPPIFLNEILISAIKFLERLLKPQVISGVITRRTSKGTACQSSAKSLMNGICGTFDMKLNYLVQWYLKRLKKNLKIEQGVIKWEKLVSKSRSKTILLWPNLRVAASLKSKADALSL